MCIASYLISNIVMIIGLIEAHIITFSHYCFEHMFQDPMANVGIFNNAVNVEIDGPAHYHREAATANTVADVHCKTCNWVLGKKFVEVQSENIVIKRGRLLLRL
ncbi:unnamed protein product [Ilex paraguariensis]|uniref:Yippee domain-containing protein n=1 Tax=Ilex paraguariensis TaxID=185542 RepID=A0ABC8V4R1_9AQUA